MNEIFRDENGKPKLRDYEWELIDGLSQEEALKLLSTIIAINKVVNKMAYCERCHQYG